MFNLRRYFSLASAAAIVAVTVTLVVLYHRHSMDELVKSAESENVTLARAFANTIWPRFSSYVMSISGADGEALRARSETHEIDDVLMTLTLGLPVLKLKIYNLDGLTVYSSQPSQIGADKSNNLGYLASARGGSPASKLSHRDTFSAFSGTVQDRDIVESYIPIWSPDGAIEGVFELYTDVTPLVARITRTTIRLTIGLLLILGVLYGVLFLIVQHAARILKKQYLDLQRSEETIKARKTALEIEVTERKRTELALQESEEQLRLVTDNLPVLITYVDSEEHFRFVNAACETWFGRRREEIIGKPIKEIHASSEYPKFQPHIAAVLSGGAVTFQESVTYPDGTPRAVEVVYVPDIVEGGRVRGFFALAQDITERKRAEEELGLVTKQLNRMSSVCR